MIIEVNIKGKPEKYWLDWYAFQKQIYWKDVCNCGHHPESDKLMTQWEKDNQHLKNETLSDRQL